MDGFAEGIADVVADGTAPWGTPASGAGEAAQDLIEAQHGILEAALHRDGIDALLAKALSWMESLLHPVGCAVVVGGDGRVHTKLSPGFPPSLVPHLDRFAAPAADGPALRRRAPARFGAQAEWFADLRLPEVEGPASLWAEPVPAGDGRASGALVLLHARPWTPSRRDAQALSTLAGATALALRVAQGESSSRSAGEAFASLTAAIPGVVYQRVLRPDGDLRYTYISESVRDLFGVSAAEVLADPQVLFGRYSPDYRENFRARLLEASRTLSTWDVEASLVMPDGRRHYTHAIARPARQDDGSVVWTGVIMDATRIKQAEAAVAEAEARTREAIVESLSQGFLMYDASDRLAVCNSHYRALYPELADTVVLGAAYADVVRAEAAPEVTLLLSEAERRAELEQRLAAHGGCDATGKHATGHHVFERQLAHDRWILVNEHRTADGGTVVLYTDVSDLKLRERRIHHIAHHDALTDLPNRVLFREKLDEALARARRSDRPVAVFCLDLDHFKHVNDTLGHPAGDALLKVVSNRLTACLRRSDTAARLGGDEFAVIVPDVPSPDYATALAWRFLDAVAQPVDVDGQQVVTAASVGIVISSPDEHDSDRLIKSADLALYHAKADGRNTFRYFEPEMDAKAQARRALEMDLRMAIACDEMDLHYQPVVDVFTDEIIAFEALVRWKHPKRGAVPPLDFIGLAEETGIIKQLGAWILRTACAAAVTWPDSVRIAVNLSPAQFKDRELADIVLRILEETGLDPSRLELEITESLLLRDTDANLATLHRLKDAGIRISMDDFGTGYSSLGNLRSFPFDKIKIDQSFVKDLEKNPDSASIVRAVLSLGRSLGMGTIAEGVETREQLSRLRAEGCTEIQGFYYSKPKPAAEITEMLKAGMQKRLPKLPMVPRRASQEQAG